MASSKPSVSVVFPAYNEAAAIPQTIQKTKEVMDASGYPYEILVIDDGSADNTAELSRKEGARCVQHRSNYGVGRARKTGIIHATHELIVMADADGTYPLHSIPDVVAALEHADMVIGARQVEMGTHRALRTFAKNFIKGLASFITATDIPDLNSGLRGFRKSDAKRFFNILPEGHSWVSTITIAFLTNGYEVKWIPIEYYERIGTSTFTPFGDTANYLGLVVRTVMYFNPIRAFMPVSGVVGLFAVLKILYDWLILSDIKESDIAMLILSFVLLAIGLLADLAVAHNKKSYMKPLEPEFTPTKPEEPIDG